MVTVDGLKSRSNICPIKIKYESFIVPLFSTANFRWPRFANFFAKVLDLAPGGEWTPKACVPRFFVALIIAYQDEESNLRDFLLHMHPFLQAQNIHYRIYVIEQTLKKRFNTGALLNVGFIEARKDALYPCFIFHDINVLPKNLNNIYACSEAPRHILTMITADDGPKLTDEKSYVGAISLLSSHFELINGFSNEFYKWGSSDKDFYHRILNAGLQPLRFNHNTSSYYSLPHKLPQRNPNADDFHQIEGKAFHRGLNTMNYTVISHSDESLFTRIIVDL